MLNILFLQGKSLHRQGLGQVKTRESRLKDPDQGVHHNNLLKQNLNDENSEVLALLDYIPNTLDPKWTSSISQLPLSKIVHSVFETYFQKSGDSKHIKEGYTFSKTLKFETSDKPMRVNIVNEKHFLLEGYTRPAMKSSKGISQGKGIDHCVIAFSRTTGEIVQDRDYSCPAGKRGYCKHVAALAYKLVDSAKPKTKKESLPSSLTCTQIKQKWGLPSLRAEQDPEKEMLKRQPLQTVSFQRQILDRDLSGGRKRKLPNETLSTYSSKPVKEPFISVSDFDNLAADLNKSKCQSTLLLAIKTGRTAVNSGVNSSTTVVQHSDLLAEKETFTSKQGSNEWYKQDYLVEAANFNWSLWENEFDKAWECIRNKVPEESKSFQNFNRGKIYESIATDTFEHSSGLKLSESPLILHPNDSEHYAASPDRILDVGSIFFAKL